MIKKTLLITLILSSAVFAMQIIHESLDSVLRKTRAAVVVEIESVGSVQEDRFSRKLEFTATPLKTIFGELASDSELRFLYSEGRPHTRGRTDVSPLVSGSGMEFRLRKGDKVIVLIGDDNGRQECLTVLRVEQMETLKLIERHGSRRKHDDEHIPADR